MNSVPSSKNPLSVADEIEAQLQAAKAVMVIWSADAARSEWVRSEADRARVDRKLVQVTVDGALLPMPFDQIQCADLVAWTGDPQAAGWRTVVASVAALTGSTRDAGADVAVSRQPAEIVVAVLPFDNLSTDPEMEFFSDGVSEEIIQRLSRGANLKVIGRTSSFQFRGEGYFLPVSSYQSNKGVPAAPIGQSLPRISLSTRNEIGRNARAASTSPKMALMRDSNPNVADHVQHKLFQRDEDSGGGELAAY